jgi:hypothetical protein
MYSHLPTQTLFVIPSEVEAVTQRDRAGPGFQSRGITAGVSSGDPSTSLCSAQDDREKQPLHRL